MNIANIITMAKNTNISSINCNKVGDYYEDSSANYKEIIYMDYQSTTPMDQRVIDVMINVMQNDFGNPHSVSHVYGWRAKDIVKIARSNIANVIGAQGKDIIFTSGATESNNLALKGVCNFYKSDNKDHIITTSIEHKCILQTCKFLETEGFKVTYLKPNSDGLINLNELEESITSRTIIVSLFGLHNEIGVINHLQDIGRITRRKGVLFHTDIAQAFGKIPINVDEMNIDLASISGHKIYGPKGIGALYIRRKPKVKVLPIMHGGGQERGLRSGTLPTPSIAGFGEAASIAMEDFEKDQEHISKLGDMLCKEVLNIPHVHLNGSLEQRYKGSWNFGFEFIEGESLLMSIKNIAVSSGSACTSDTLEPSYVLKQLGVREELAHSSIRFGIGRQTKEQEIEQVVESIANGVKRLRALSPLWEMHQNGIDISKIEWKHH